MGTCQWVSYVESSKSKGKELLYWGDDKLNCLPIYDGHQSRDASCAIEQDGLAYICDQKPPVRRLVQMKHSGASTPAIFLVTEGTLEKSGRRLGSTLNWLSLQKNL